MPRPVMISAFVGQYIALEMIPKNDIIVILGQLFHHWYNDYIYGIIIQVHTLKKILYIWHGGIVIQAISCQTQLLTLFVGLCPFMDKWMRGDMQDKICRICRDLIIVAGLLICWRQGETVLWTLFLFSSYQLWNLPEINANFELKYFLIGCVWCCSLVADKS